MLLRAGLRVLWRARDEVQIGTDARWAVRLTGLTPAEVDLLLSVDRVEPALDLVTHAASLGVGPERLHALVAELDRAQLTTGAGELEPRADVPPRLGPDAATWTRLLDDGRGSSLLAARRPQVVGLAGAGRLGLTAAVTLAAGGVGCVLVEDDRTVTHADLGAGGYTARDVGSPRSVAAARVLRGLCPDVSTTAPERTRPDVMVLVEHGAADALRARALMSAGVVHLSIVVREADVVVGPLVRPGSSPCLRCLDLHRTDADERWPAIAAQLVGITPEASPDEETVLAAIAGSLAAGQVLAQLDGMAAATLGASLEVALPEAVPRLREWTVHPDCGCTRLPRTGGGRPPSRGG